MFWKYIYDCLWNNALDYEVRKNFLWEAKIWINNFIEGDILEDFSLWNKTVFEIFDYNKILSFSGLKNFILDLKRKVFLVDNHNYILWAWLIDKIKKYLDKSLPMIHIDQHSDLKDFDEYIDIYNLYKELFLKTNVWNYIKPMIKYWLIERDIQIRTEYSLEKLYFDGDYYLNIDLDFWDDNMGVWENTLNKVKKLINNAKFTFIATSPYFMDKNKVFYILKELFI